MKTSTLMDLKINQQYYDNFPEHISMREDRIKLWWENAIHFTFQDIVLNDKIILEIGAGKGFLDILYPFTPKHLFYTDISFSRFRMNKYKELFPVQSTGILNDANIPCFKNGIFDIIVFVNCLMFIDDKVKLIEHYKNFLTTNGKIIIMDVLDGNFFYRIRKKLSLEYDKVSTKNITYNEIEEICQKSVIVKKNYFYFLSILSALFLLRSPENMIVRKIHCVVEKIDSYILQMKTMQPYAVVASVVISKM